MCPSIDDEMLETMNSKELKFPQASHAGEGKVEAGYQPERLELASEERRSPDSDVGGITP